MSRPRAIVCLLTILTVLSACSTTTSTPPPAPSAAAVASPAAASPQASVVAEASPSPAPSLASAAASPSAAASASTAASASAAASSSAAPSASAAASPEAPTPSAAPDASPDPTLPSAAPVAVAPAITFGEAWESVDCATLGVAAELAPGADCGNVRVPENRATGGDRTITVPVVRVRAADGPSRTPIMLATGGPGSNGLARTAYVQALLPFAPLLADRDWIFFSQRGTARSDPQLACPDYMRIAADAALEGLSDGQRRDLRVPRIEACVAEDTAAGIDLGSYNSDENAADVDSIREALGYDKIILYGQSYGTQLAQFVMRNHPEILEAVVIDGVVPVAVTAESDVNPPTVPFAPIFAACAADATCSSTYGDAEAALREAYAALEAAPAQLELAVDGTPTTVAVDGTLALNALYSSLYPGGNYATLPYVATAMRDGNYAPLIPLLNDALQPGPISIVMHMAITCTDDPNVEVPEPASGDPYADIAYDDNTQYSAVCPVMGVERLPDTSDEAVQSELPVLILQGAFDPVTPTADGDRVAETLPNSTNVVFSQGGHINGTNACGVGIIAAFLNDPSQELDTSCAQPPLAFAVPQTVSAASADGSATVSVTLPPGWTTGANNSYLDASNNTLVLLVQPPQAPESALAAITAPYGGGTITDGEPIAGLPSKRYQLNDFAVGQATINLDVIAFGNDAATYVLFAQNQVPGALSLWRSAELPSIVQTATVGGP